MKYFYIAVIVKQDTHESVFTPRADHVCDFKYYGDVVRCSECQDVAAVLRHIGGLESAYICASSKQAAATVKLWNESFKEHGRYFGGGV